MFQRFVSGGCHMDNRSKYELITRIEYILNYLSETDDKVYELDDVWSLIFHGCRLLEKRGRKVRLPAHVTNPDGTEYITDWYEE